MKLTPEQRIERLERLLDKLCFALERRGTEQDGNWGRPNFSEELREIRAALEDRGDG